MLFGNDRTNNMLTKKFIKNTITLSWKTINECLSFPRLSFTDANNNLLLKKENTAITRVLALSLFKLEPGYCRVLFLPWPLYQISYKKFYDINITRQLFKNTLLSSITHPLHINFFQFISQTQPSIIPLILFRELNCPLLPKSCYTTVDFIK